MSEADTCGCCSGITTTTPAEKSNRPGLPAIAYRVGTYTTFRESLLARLSSTDHPFLQNLSTRRDDDWTIGLLDAFAVLGDVLTFYQERLANEAFLRTALERRSVVELARLVGYRLAPGVAANTSLAFTLDQPLTQPAPPPLPVTIPVGTRVQSVPGPDELPQTFETSAAIVARVEWNDVGIQRWVAEHPYGGQTTLFLKGTSTLLQPGDAIALIAAERRLPSQPRTRPSDKWNVRWVERVAVDNARGITRVDWSEPLEHFSDAHAPDTEGVEIYALRQRAALFGHNAIDPTTLDFKKMENLKEKQWELIIEPNPEGDDDTRGFRWKGYRTLTNPVDLDSGYPKVVKGSWLAFAGGSVGQRSETLHAGGIQLFRAKEVQQVSVADFGLSGKVSRITLDTADDLTKFSRRRTSVYAQSELLSLSPRPILYPVFGKELPLASVQPLLTKGRLLALEGKRQRLAVASNPNFVFFPQHPDRKALPNESFIALRAPIRVLNRGRFEPATNLDAGGTLRWIALDAQGRQVTIDATLEALALQPARTDDLLVQEVAIIAASSDPDGRPRERTTLKLTEPLVHCYDRATLQINANVAPATHGETVGEIAGSGAASLPNQRFQLRQSPLTCVSAHTARGRQAALEVRVNDLLWKEVDSLFEQPATARVYSLRQDAEDHTIVQFGNGAEGARLPTGTDNVRMTYRKGLGNAGNVRAGTVTTLLSRPLGVKSAVNPTAAIGGEDPEAEVDTKTNAPNTVLTLDRAVSIQDYIDFTRGYAGIAKATAVWIPSGIARGVHITAAAADGGAIQSGADPYDALFESLRAYGDALLPLTLSTYDAATFALALKVKIDPDYRAEDVIAKVIARLTTDFSFAARCFNQPTTLDEVMASAHAIDGVLAVDVDTFHRSDTAAGARPEPRILPVPATIQPDGTVSAAELLVIDPQKLVVSVMP